MMSEHQIKEEFAKMREELAELEYHRWMKRSFDGEIRRAYHYCDLDEEGKKAWRAMADEDLAIFDGYVKRVLAGHVK